MTDVKKIYLPDIVGKGYGTFWKSKHMYRVVKGSRRSKKSTSTALNIPYLMMLYPESNTLVVRKTYRTIQDSCYAQLKWAVHQLGVDHLWEFKLSPLEATYKPTGQKIFFRGLDDPLKITSITVERGALTFMWVEEAFEIDSEKDFDTLVESMLGYCPEGHYKQITLTFNPWSSSHWLKKKFFDTPREDVLAITTNYMCNEWLSEEDKKVFEQMKRDNPERYQTAGLGDWGIDGMVAFGEFREDVHTCTPFVIPEHWTRYRAFDYGMDMLACLWVAVDENGRAYVYDEVYEPGLIISDASAKILQQNNDEVLCTYAPPDMWAASNESGKSKSDIFGENGVPVIKSMNSRVQGWANVHEWLRPDDSGKPYLTIFRNCRNLIRCLPQICVDDKNINDVAKQPHELTHVVDALRYWCVNYPIPAEVPVEPDEDYTSYDDGLDNFFNYGG